MLYVTQFGTIIKDESRDEYRKMATIDIYSKYHKKSFTRLLFYSTGKHFVIPRFLAPDSPRVSRLANTPDLAFTQAGHLAPHQINICDLLKEYFSPENVKAGRAGAILKLDMGAGKSFIAMEMIGHLRKKTLIVCHVSNMIEQWRKNIMEWFPKCTVGAISGKKKSDGDIVIGLIQTLSKPEINEAAAHLFFKQFGTIIFDEAHLYCSESYSQIFKNCQVQNMLGLSGTPYNEDGSHQIIECNIGPIFDADEMHTSQKFAAEVEVIEYQTPRKYRELMMREKEVDYQSTLGNILSNPERLTILVEKIEELAKERNIFVFADRRDYLARIQKELETKGVEMHLVMGGATEEDIETAVKHARIIGTTYQFMSTGRSISKMNGIVFATPRKTRVEQTLGRIFRSGSSMEVRKIIDFNDIGTILVSQFRVRNQIYIDRGYSLK